MIQNSKGDNRAPCGTPSMGTVIVEDIFLFDKFDPRDKGVTNSSFG